MADKKTAWQLLRNKYPEGECVLMEEVSDTTGGRNRSADFIVVNLWPSRGNSIIGFERKSFRSDWQSELKKPNKQEAIFKFCDYFYLLTDKDNVAKIEEIPENWGWMHCENSRIKIIKNAPKLQSIPCSSQFMCAMLRRAASKEGYVHKSDIEERIELGIEQAVAKRIRENDRKIKEYDELVTRVGEFEKASGVDIRSRWSWNSGKEIGEAVKTIMTWQTVNQEEKLQRLKKHASDILDSINKQIEQYEKIPLIEEVIN